MLCQHVQNTQLIQNNILEKLSVPDETENIVYYTRESRLSFNIKLYIYFSWGLSRSHHCYRHWIKRIFLRFIFVLFRNKNLYVSCNYNLDYLKLLFCHEHKTRKRTLYKSNLWSRKYQLWLKWYESVHLCWKNGS